MVLKLWGERAEGQMSGLSSGFVSDILASMGEGDSPTFKMPCPHCGQHIEFPTQGVGQVIDCPTCSNPLTLACPQPPVISPPSRVPESGASWRDHPATEKQLNYLRQFGYVSDRPLTKGDASDLISSFEEDSERIAIRDANNARDQAQAWDAVWKFQNENTAWHLHEEFESARRCFERADKEDRALAKSDMNDCLRNRVAFWMDTFSSTPRDYDTAQWAHLFETCGRFFKKPTAKQVKDVLAALDAHTPNWDQDKPQSFFHTLKINFPELLR